MSFNFNSEISALTLQIDVIWQFLYWKVNISLFLFYYGSWGIIIQFLLVDRRAKIQSGQRTTSFSWLLNDKRGVIGRSLASIPPAYRELTFMGGQLSQSLHFAHQNTQLIILLSICHTHRAARNFCFLPKFFLECCIPHIHLCRQCLEWRRVLHWSLWAKVSIYLDWQIIHLIANILGLNVNWRPCERNLQRAPRDPQARRLLVLVVEQAKQISLPWFRHQSSRAPQATPTPQKKVLHIQTLPWIWISRKILDRMLVINDDLFTTLYDNSIA